MSPTKTSTSVSLLDFMPTSGKKASPWAIPAPKQKRRSSSKRRGSDSGGREGSPKSSSFGRSLEGSPVSQQYSWGRSPVFGPAESPPVDDLASIMAAEENRRRRSSKARLGAVDGHRNRWYLGENNAPGRSIEEIQREESEKEETLRALAQVAALQAEEQKEKEAALAAVSQFEQKQRRHSNSKRRNNNHRKPHSQRQGKKHFRGNRGNVGGAQSLVAEHRGPGKL